MASKKKRPRLPRTMSTLIRVALNDLAKVERSKRYEIHMNSWHLAPRDSYSDNCAVCFGGAVMAKSLGADPTKTLAPHNFGADKYALFALNCLRSGEVAEAAAHLKIPVAKFLATQIEITDYELDPRAFRRDMRKLANDLEKAGL